MDRGTYIATSGGVLQFRKLEVVNNNLANTNTPGFKKQILTGQLQTFDQTLAKMVAGQNPFAQGDHERTPGTTAIASATDFSQGPIKATGNPLDVALTQPNDFFVIQTPSGTQYTRAGDFTLNANGEIVTHDGMTVQGDGGPISATGVGVSITEAGVVTSGGLPVGTLQVVRMEHPEDLERVGASRFSLPAGKSAPTPVDPQLAIQSLEMPNVSAISSTIDLITTNRAFDLYTKSVQSIDAMNQQAIGQIGRRQG